MKILNVLGFDTFVAHDFTCTEKRTKEKANLDESDPEDSNVIIEELKEVTDEVAEDYEIVVE